MQGALRAETGRLMKMVELDSQIRGAKRAVA